MTVGFVTPVQQLREARRQAYNFIELEELKDVIGRPPRPVTVEDAPIAANED